MKNSDWFYVEPYVHISVKDKCALLYNTLNEGVVKVDGDLDLLNLLLEVISPQNLRVVEVPREQLERENFKSFVAAIKGIFAGDILDRAWSSTKPVEIPPTPRIQKDRSRLIDGEFWRKENLVSYITEMCFYLSSYCETKHDLLSDAYKQILMPCGNVMRGTELKFALMKETIMHLGAAGLTFLGGDVFEYSEFRALMDFLTSVKLRKRFHIMYEDIVGNEAKLDLMRESDVELEIVFPPSPSSKIAKLVCDLLHRKEIDCHFMFVVTSDINKKESENLADVLGISNFYMEPFFDGKNLNFFETNVYLTEEEIVESKPSMGTIVQRMEINPLNFGRLIVLPDGTVVSNVCKPALGTLGRDSLGDLVLNEIKANYAWFVTRQQVTPCKNCIYEFVCPPLSNHEQTIGKSNLCNVHR